MILWLIVIGWFVCGLYAYGTWTAEFLFDLENTIPNAKLSFRYYIEEVALCFIAGFLGAVPAFVLTKGNQHGWRLY